MEGENLNQPFSVTTEKKSSQVERDLNMKEQEAVK